MIRRMMLAFACTAGLTALLSANEAQAQQAAQQAYGRQWGRSPSTKDWNRFYHYPFVYYPQNFWSKEYYRSSDDMYYRYPQEMRIPVYNTQWHNMYPEGQVWHGGHHFILDTF